MRAVVGFAQQASECARSLQGNIVLGRQSLNLQIHAMIHIFYTIYTYTCILCYLCK